MAFVRPLTDSLWSGSEVIRRHCPECGERVAVYLLATRTRESRWVVHNTCGHDAPLPSAEETADLVTRHHKTGKVVKYHARPRADISSSLARPARAGVPQ